MCHPHEFKGKKVFWKYNEETETFENHGITRQYRTWLQEEEKIEDDLTLLRAEEDPVERYNRLRILLKRKVGKSTWVPPDTDKQLKDISFKNPYCS